MSVSYGLLNSDDMLLCDWMCTILGPPGSPVDSRIVSVKVSCGPEYPDKAPNVCFVTKVNFPFVGSNGDVASAKLPILNSWNRNCRIEGVLQDLRKQMSKPEYKKLAQPPETATF